MLRPSRFLLLFTVVVLASQAAISMPASAQTVNQNPTIEELLKSRWQVAGFASAGNNRNAMVLFKHPTETFLVQCLTGYDVTRTPREFVTCYSLH